MREILPFLPNFSEHLLIFPSFSEVELTDLRVIQSVQHDDLMI